MSGKAKRCAIYIRVSTEEQNLNGLSLPAQKKELTDYANANGYVIVDIYADEGISARKPMKYRKDLLRLLEDVKADKIDMILVTKLDRWFRNIKDYNITEDILAAHNCHWKTIFESYDSSTANGLMVINIMLSVNQAECDRTSERIKAVFKYKKQNRDHINGKPAYGYKSVNGKLVKDEETRAIVEDIIAYYFQTYSKRKTRIYITDKYRDKAPTVYQIERILSSETYTGMKYGIEHYCDAYMTKDQFERIQKVTQSKIYTGTNQVYYFSSLIVCPVCNNKFTGFTKTQKLKNGGISKYKRYRCENKFNRHNTACITENVIEQYLLDHIPLQLEADLLTISQSRQKRKVKDQSAGIRSEMERLNIQFQKGRITEEYYDTQYELLSEKLKKNASENKTVSLDAYRALQDTFSGDWKEIYMKLDDARKQVFWKDTIEYITVDRETHKVNGFKFLL